MGSHEARYLPRAAHPVDINEGTKHAVDEAPARRHLTRLAYVASIGLLLLVACGGGDDAGDSEPGSEVVVDATAADPGGDGRAGGVDPLDQLIATSDAHDEVATESGGRVVVAVICEAQTGGTVVSVGSVGVPEGVYQGDFEPAAGGSLTLQVLPDGEGVGARQTTLDEPSYTVSFADIGGGIELIVPGCMT